MESYSNVKEKYRKSFIECKLLLEVESTNDLETDPYRSKYKMRDIFLENVKSLKNDIEQIDPTHPDHEFCKLYLNLVYLQIGTISVETEEFSEGVNYLKKCLENIENPINSNAIFASVEARNNLGYVWLCRSKPEEAVKILLEAEKLYYEFRSDRGRLARSIFDSPSVFGEEELETSHTMTKFYLAQAYEVLNDSFKSSVYCHETLKRQLKQKNYDPIHWALNSAKLSQFFIDRMLFKQGKHHLAAASYILDEYENNLKDMEGSQEEMDDKKEELRHRSADLSWCWAKYGIIMLKHSRYVLSESRDDIAVEKQEDLDRLWFEGLDLTRYENQITDENVVSFEDAREVFLTCQKFFNQAKEYYTLEDRASSHVEIVRGHSQLFQILAAFEPNPERQFKMLKKRVGMLEVVLKELNPKYYMDLCRQLWFELGEIYHDMMQLKTLKIEVVPTLQSINKINSLIESSVKNFSHFIDSVKDKETGGLPDPIEKDLISSILTAHFYLGRLYFKYISLDKLNLSENLKKAVENFKYLADYCDKKEEVKAAIEEQYQISKELMPLLQMKLLKL